MAHPHESAIDTWFLTGRNPGGYETSPGHIKSKAARTPDFGTLMTHVRTSEAPASAWLGGRVRFSAEVKANAVTGWAGLWMRVDGAREERRAPRMLAFDNMQSRAIKGTADWTRHEVVLDVAADARAICFGLVLSGDGELWIRDATLDLASPDTPTTGGRAAPAEGSILEDNLKPFMQALGWIIGTDLGGEDDWTALYFGVRDTDVEAARWYEYPLSPSSKIALARDPGSGVLFVRVDVDDWHHREVELAMEIFARFTVAGAKFEAP